jgi:hypothetical protein
MRCSARYAQQWRRNHYDVAAAAFQTAYDIGLIPYTPGAKSQRMLNRAQLNRLKRDVRRALRNIGLLPKPEQPNPEQIQQHLDMMLKQEEETV